MPGGFGIPGIPGGGAGGGIGGGRGVPSFRQHGASGGPIRVGGRSEGPSGSGGLADRIAFYRQYAESKGLDPDLVTGIVMGEGHKGPKDSWSNSDKSRSGKPGTSYGDFQLRRSAQGGMGDDFARSHPDVPMDEAHWKEQGKYAIDHMAKEGNGAWMSVGDRGGKANITAQGAKWWGGHKNQVGQAGELAQPGKANSPSAVDNMMSIVGKRDHTPQERADIETFLKTGGHGMDPAKTSWCAAAVGSALHKAGYQDIPAEKGGNIANAYQDWGRRVDPAREKIQKDDVLVTTRGGRPGQMGGHISLLTGEQDKRGRYKVVEGDTRNYNSPGHYAGHKADTDWENINQPGMMIRRGTRQSSPDAPTQVARKDTTTPRSIPSYKAAAEEPKPTQAAPQGVKEASQATPFLSPENTTYTSKQAHMVRGQVEMGNNAPVELVSTSPPPKPDSPEQVRKNDLAASQMVDKWKQNYQGSSGRADIHPHTPSDFDDTGEGGGTTPHIEKKGNERYLGIGQTPIQRNLDIKGLDIKHPGASPWTGSTDMRANIKNIPLQNNVPLMASGTSPSQQAHELTPPTRRDPEMSRSIPSQNQPLHEMSHGRAVAHEKAARHRPTPAAHAGTGSHHTPEASGGKHSTMPYGYDAGHFDSGLRDRFLNQYLDGMG